MPAKAGIQYGIDSHEARFLDPGFLRGDESFFNKLLVLFQHGKLRAVAQALLEIF